MSFEEDRKQAIRMRNAQNRARAKTMERNIAKLLRGRRQPYSGAGVDKGDVRVPITADGFDRRFYLVECKISSQISDGVPRISFPFKWIRKITDEAVQLNAEFGAVVIQFLGSRDYYFILPWELFATDAVKIYHEISYPDKRSYLLKKNKLVDILKSADALVLATDMGRFVICDHRVFNEWLEEKYAYRTLSE